jgi:hypothetical protein
MGWSLVQKSSFGGNEGEAEMNKRAAAQRLFYFCRLPLQETPLSSNRNAGHKLFIELVQYLFSVAVCPVSIKGSP